MAPFAKSAAPIGAGVIVALALGLTLAASPALAHPPALATAVDPAGRAAHALQLHLPLGRQANGSGPGQFKLNVAAPHKIGPTPVKTPEFNPLKRRRMAMPALDPDTQLAF